MLHFAISRAVLSVPAPRATPPVQGEMPAITGRRILVTGAGGSIGSELVRQIAVAKPSQLTLLDISEMNLYECNLALTKLRPRTRWNVCLGDVRDLEGMRHLFVKFKPDVVFHAAALKHVPMLEDGHNLIEAVRTNVFGTKVICDLCAARGIGLVLVSTDKAVNPSCAMGLTKRVAEIYVHEAALRHPEAQIGQVRFGNVLGSSGSVVPLFRRQIQEGGPVTITHPEMTRYLMTIEDAAALTLSAANLTRNGYALYVLDMGEPVKIVDLARNMIEHAGLRPDIDVPIEFIGVRPGEKIHEELSYPWEKLQETAVPGVRMAVPTFNPRPRTQMIDDLLVAAHARRVAQVRQALVRVVPEFRSQAFLRNAIALVTEDLSRAGHRVLPGRVLPLSALAGTN